MFRLHKVDLENEAAPHKAKNRMVKFDTAKARGSLLMKIKFAGGRQRALRIIASRCYVRRGIAAEEIPVQGEKLNER
jgi:hypothetical protein